MMKILFALSTFCAPLAVVHGAVALYLCEGEACEFDYPETCEKLLTENDYAGDCCSLSTQSFGCRLTVTNGQCIWTNRPVSIWVYDGRIAFQGVVASTQTTAISDLASECPASEFDALGRLPAKEGTVEGLIMTLRGVEGLTSEQLAFEWAPAYVEHANNNNLDLDTVNRVVPYFARSNFPGTVAVYFLHTISYRSETDIDLDTLIDNLFTTDKAQAFLGLLRQKGASFETARSIVFSTRQQVDLSGELTLEGIGSLTEDELDDFQRIVQNYIITYYEGQTDATVTSVSATVQVTNREELTGGSSRRRKLQDSITIAYDLLISFRTTDDNLTPLELASKPFIETIATLEGSLQNGGGSLGQVASISANKINTGIGDSAMSLGSEICTLASLLLISIGCGFL